MYEEFNNPKHLKQSKMNNIKSILILSVLMLVSQIISAQQMRTDSIQKAMAAKKWSFSLSLGAALIGPGAALNNEMKKIGFNDKPNDLNFFGIFTIKNKKVYPQIKRAAAWDLEVRFNLSKKSAFSMAIGQSHHYTAKGYSRKGYQNFNGSGYDYYLTIVHDVLFVSADYVFRYEPGYGGISVGPVMAIHRVSEGGSSGPFVKTSSFKSGFHIGADIPLFQKQVWFMAFGFNYTWLPPATIGPNTENFRKSTGSAFPFSNPSGNTNITIPLATVQMNLTTGWRF